MCICPVYLGIAQDRRFYFETRLAPRGYLNPSLCNTCPNSWPGHCPPPEEYLGLRASLGFSALGTVLEEPAPHHPGWCPPGLQLTETQKTEEQGNRSFFRIG